MMSDLIPANTETTETPTTGEASPPIAVEAEIDATDQPGSVETYAALKPEDFERLSTEFAEKGTLTDETFQVLEKNHGLPKTVVEGYIRGQKAIAEAQQNALYAEYGGKDKYDQMVQWGQKSLTEDERNEINASFQNPTTRQLALRYLKDKFEAANAQAAPPIVGTATGDANARGFASPEEAYAAMKDPRWINNDPAYVREVREKLTAAQRPN